MKRLTFTLVVAAVLWTLMFCPLTASHLPFWWMMTGSALALCVLSSIFNPGWWKGVRFSIADVLLGLGIAAVLWGVFWVGDKVAALLFSFARPQVSSIYDMKEGWSPALLSLLMLILIGPAEEIFWRGYVQRVLSQRLGGCYGFLLATLLYALVHVGALNFMLLMAALTAGCVWGLLYWLWPRRFGAIIVSHAVWDVAVFILFPI